MTLPDAVERRLMSEVDKATNEMYSEALAFWHAVRYGHADDTAKMHSDRVLRWSIAVAALDEVLCEYEHDRQRASRD